MCYHPFWQAFLSASSKVCLILNFRLFADLTQSSSKRLGSVEGTGVELGLRDVP